MPVTVSFLCWRSSLLAHVVHYLSSKIMKKAATFALASRAASASAAIARWS